MAQGQQAPPPERAESRAESREIGKRRKRRERETSSEYSFKTTEAAAPSEVEVVASSGGARLLDPAVHVASTKV